MEGAVLCPEPPRREPGGAHVPSCSLCLVSDSLCCSPLSWPLLWPSLNFCKGHRPLGCPHLALHFLVVMSPLALQTCPSQTVPPGTPPTMLPHTWPERTCDLGRLVRSLLWPFLYSRGETKGLCFLWIWAIRARQEGLVAGSTTIWKGQRGS